MAKKSEVQLEENQVQLDRAFIYEGKTFGPGVVTINDEKARSSILLKQKRLRRKLRDAQVNNEDGATTMIRSDMRSAPLPERVKAPASERKQVEEGRLRARGPVPDEETGELEEEKFERRSRTKGALKASVAAAEDDEEVESSDEEESEVEETEDLRSMKTDELRALAAERGVRGDIDSMSKKELIKALEE